MDNNKKSTSGNAKHYGLWEMTVGDFSANPKIEVSLFCVHCNKWRIFKKKQKSKQICKCGNDKLLSYEKYVEYHQNLSK